MAGRELELKRSASRKIWPSVIEMTLVGMYAETSPAWVSINGSDVSDPPPSSSLSCGGAFEEAAVKVEDVARVGFASGGTAQQE